MKRIKRVFTTADQVLHIWANQSQDDARCDNVFFNGKSCYSYGMHYELGRLIEVKGKTIALINDKGYSVTTGKHIGYALSAVSQLPHLTTKVGFSLPLALKAKRESLIEQMEGVFRQRSFYQAESFDKSYLGKDVTEFNSFCKIVGKTKLQIKVTAKYERDRLTHIKQAIALKAELKALKNDPIQIAKKQAAKVKRAAQDILNWRQGGPLTNAVRGLDLQLIRVKGDTVETSKGAQAPLDEAMRLLKLIMRGQAKLNEKIGHFRFDSMKDGLVKIGCHTISLEEAKAVLIPSLKAVSHG